MSISDSELAAGLVREAGQLALRMRADGLTTQLKTSVSDVVTAADHAAEELITSRLRAARPDDGILGEEGAANPGSSGRRWVIDPVDGTWNFVNGLAHWCSALALEEQAPDGGVLVGAVHHPHDDQVWVGGPDLPTTCNGQPLAPLADRPLSQVGVATYLHPPYLDEPAVADAWRRAVRGTATLRMLGSGSMDLVSVASGRIGCWFQHTVTPWDWRPGQALVLGAGGATAQVEVDGYTWCVAGLPTAVDEAVAALAGRAAR